MEYLHQAPDVIIAKRKEQANQIIRKFIENIFPKKLEGQQVKLYDLLPTNQKMKQLTQDEIQWFLNKVKDIKKYSVSKEKDIYAELSEKTEDFLESMKQKENVKLSVSKEQQRGCDRSYFWNTVYSVVESRNRVMSHTLCIHTRKKYNYLLN